MLIFLSYAGISHAQQRMPIPPNMRGKTCSQIRPDPKVNITTSYGVLQYDYTQTVPQLTSIGTKSGTGEAGAFVEGLAVATTIWEMSMSVLPVPEGNKICIVPVEVDIFIGYKNPVIYIAKELSPNSCRFNLVMRHEQAHMQINKSALDYFIPILAESIRKLAKDIRPVLIGNTQAQFQEAQNKFTEEYQRNIRPMVDTFIYERGKEQGKLDNYQHYKLENEVCNEFNKKY